MKFFKILCVLTFIIIPATAFAWGPLTHVYLGNEICSLGALLPAAIAETIRRYRKDFLYGNIMADIIVGKKYLPEHMNSHNWEFALDLLGAAETKQQKAFVYGYLGHLAADTVAHNTFTVDKKDFGHTLLEIKADSIIDKKYWVIAMEIDREIQMRNDVFLQNSMDRYIFSFKTHKRIFQGMVFLTVFYPEKMGDFIDRNLITSIPVRKTIERLHGDSLDRTIDLFQNWEKSAVLKMKPCGSSYGKKSIRGRILPFLVKLSGRQ